MSTRTKVTICIPTWNGLEVLKDCLKSVEVQNKNIETEIIVFDNGSNDSTINFLFENYCRIRILRSIKNLGFSKAVNRMIRCSSGSVIVILNNDAILSKSFLSEITSSFKKNVDAVCPKVINYYDREKIESVGDYINEVGQAFNRGGGKAVSSFNKTEYVDLVPASASAYRKSFFDDVGFFDNDFFAYGEDVDLSIRGKLKGKRYLYCHKARVFHKHMFTSSRFPRFREYLQFRNQTVILLKNFPLALILKKGRFIKIAAIHINTFLYMSLNGYFSEAVRAEVWVLKNIIKILKKRKEIQANKTSNSNEVLENMLKIKVIRAYGLR